MRPWSTIAISSAIFCACLSLFSTEAVAAPRADVEDLSARIRSLVADDDPQSAAALAKLVERGLPPAGLTALLDAARQARRVDLLPILVQLSAYRRPEIRARALAARAELGGAYADRAVTQAADDLELGVRRLAVVLGHANPSPVTEAVIAELLARDGELAAELAPAFVPEAGPPAQPEPEPAPEPEPPPPFSHVDPGTPEPIDADPLPPPPAPRDDVAEEGAP